MKTATQNLEDDHVYILKLTDIMIAVTKSDSHDISHFEKIVEIIKKFADGLHHAKEEDILFPKLAEKGFSAEQGPVAVMLHEHVMGRNFVKGMVENIELYKHGNKNSLKEIFMNMVGYANLLQNHIAKENNILFKMADRVLTESEQSDLLERFGEAERLKGSDQAPAVFIEWVKELAEIYKV